MDVKKQVFNIGNNKLGSGEVQFCWQPGCRWLAFVGETKVIVLVDRLGKTIVEFQLKSGGRVKYMEFDSDGDTLALFQENSSIVTVINVHSKKVFDMEIERNNKDIPSCIKWGKKDSILAVCTELGLIYIYSKITSKLIPTALTHSSAIISCDWNEEGNLITGAKDNCLSITSKLGTSVSSGTKLKENPRMVKWAKIKADKNSDTTNTVSFIQGNKALIIFNPIKKTNSLQLDLNENQGQIIKYEWFGDGYIAVAFSRGFINVINTQSQDAMKEAVLINPFKTSIDDMSICDEVNRIAVAGENKIKIYDSHTYKEITDEQFDIPLQAGRINKIEWSDSGHILIVSTVQGNIFSFNVVVNDSYAVSKNTFATLWSLNEIQALSIEKETILKLYSVVVPDEPKSISISSNFFICNIGMSILIYQTAELIKANADKSVVKSVKRDFSSNISHICNNKESIAILSEGRVHFMRIDGESEKIFPLKDTDDVIYYCCLTEDFLIYCDSSNRVRTYLTSNTLSPISEFKFEHPIKKMYPNEIGTRIICVNNYGKAFYYNPVTETALPLKNDSEYINILWDYSDTNLFCAYSSSNLLYVYSVIDDTLDGLLVTTVKELNSVNDINSQTLSPCVMKLDNTSIPFYLNNGNLYLFSKSSKDIKGSILTSHIWLYNYRNEKSKEDEHVMYFLQSVQLLKFQQALKAASYLGLEASKYYSALGKTALKYLEIHTSEEAFRRAGEVSLALSVEQLSYENDKKILLGYIASLLGQIDKAEMFFLQSSNPSLAVDLRCDLQDWSLALKLCKQYQPYRECFICRKLGYQLESSGNASEAIKMYTKSKISNILHFINILENDLTNVTHRNVDSKDLEYHNIQCEAGIARCCLRLGDTTKAMEIILKMNDKQLLLEVAYLAENLNYNMEAAKLFTMVGMFEKACSIYIAIKQFKLAEELIDKIKSVNLLVQMARMKENEKLYKDAEHTYERAGEWEHVIRINLDYLKNIDKAKDIVLNKHKTEAAALLVAEAFEKLGRKKETIEFKLIAKKYDEAFALAQTFNEMEIYAKYISEFVSSKDEFKKIAIYYEGKNMFGKSGIYYEKSKMNEKALQMYIKSKDDEYLEKAVEMVGFINETKLTNDLIDYLLMNNIESGPHFLIKLYIFLGNYTKACEIGIDLSVQEQILSNYSNAHKILWDLYVLLKEKNLPVSYDCNHRLSILHSYILGKKLNKFKLYLGAARNFLRVANNIQMFEKSDVIILINLCLFCESARLEKSASEWAFTLMDNVKYKDKLVPQYKDTIFKLAKKAYKNHNEPLESNSPCPFCKTMIPEYNLTCGNCYNVIPFCIASGKHVITSDLYCCPHCSFPSIGKELREYLEKENSCPLCSQEIDLQLLEPVQDIVEFFKSRKVAKIDDKEKEKKTGN